MQDTENATFWDFLSAHAMPWQPCHIIGTRFKSLQHNQCNSGQHREHIQYILSTPRKHTEKTENAQKSLRNHSENTQKTLRAHSPHLRGVPSSAGRHLFRNKLPEKDPFNFSIFLMDADNIRQMTTFVKNPKYVDFPGKKRYHFSPYFNFFGYYHKVGEVGEVGESHQSSL